MKRNIALNVSINPAGNIADELLSGAISMRKNSSKARPFELNFFCDGRLFKGRLLRCIVFPLVICIETAVGTTNYNHRGVGLSTLWAGALRLRGASVIDA